MSAQLRIACGSQYLVPPEHANGQTDLVLGCELSAGHEGSQRHVNSSAKGLHTIFVWDDEGAWDPTADPASETDTECCQ